MHSRMRKKRERKRKRTRIHALGSCQEFMRIGRIYRPRKTSPSPEESRLISIRRYFIVTSYYCAFLRCGERRKGSLDGFRPTIFSPYIHTYIYIYILYGSVFQDEDEKAKRLLIISSNSGRQAILKERIPPPCYQSCKRLEVQLADN